METKQSIEATCPDCRGPLSVIRRDGLTEVECLVGHCYSVRGVLAAHNEAQEKALWSAMVALEEATNLVEAVRDTLPRRVAERLTEQAKKKREQAQVLRRVLEDLEALEVEPFDAQKIADEEPL